MLEREVGGEGEFILEETWLHKLGQLSVYKFLKTVKIKWGKSNKNWSQSFSNSLKLETGESLVET